MTGGMKIPARFAPFSNVRFRWNSRLFCSGLAKPAPASLSQPGLARTPDSIRLTPVQWLDEAGVGACQRVSINPLPVPSDNVLTIFRRKRSPTSGEKNLAAIRERNTTKSFTVGHFRAYAGPIFVFRLVLPVIETSPINAVSGHLRWSRIVAFISSNGTNCPSRAT